MARKRKAVRQPTGPTGPKDYDPKDARLGPVTTYEDLADEQEEYFLEKDRIMFEDEPGTKRQRRIQKEDEFLEFSDEEVLAAADSDDESDSDDGRPAGKKTKKSKAGDSDDEMDDGDGAGEEGDEGWWGASRKEYYDGEVIETEDNALEEEAEARRLQKKQLSRMTAADFFDGDEWVTEGAEATTEASTPAGAVVTVKMKTTEEVDAMTPEERHKLLQTLYPEFDYMCDEFAELEPVLNEYKKAAEGKAGNTLEAVQYRVLGCYLSTMAMYFSLLMAPTRDNPNGSRSLMDPEELHNHEVMEYLVDSRQTWEWVKRVQERRKAAAAAAGADKDAPQQKTLLAEELSLPEDVMAVELAAEPKAKTKKSKADKKETAKDSKAKKEKKSLKASKEVEESIADLSALLAKNKKKKKAALAAAKAARDSDDESEDDEVDEVDGHSDFGEEEAMDARTAEEKIKRKKSLAFYTSQIMQKANKRADASGQAGGDLDIPYRERLRDRQARLNAAAARRGQAQGGDELGGDDEEDDGPVDKTADEQDENLQYYNNIVKAHRQKMDAKATRKAEAQAGLLARVEPEMTMDKDGRRQITREIEKNKGLSHRTMKERKNNPRVKKRVKFEKKTKQLASKRAVYKEGVNRDSYQGELTGIKTGLVRSIKLS